MDCNCPESSALTEIDLENCGVNMNQIQRIAIQRNTPNAFTPATIILLATWQAFSTAVDSTKIIFTPMIGGDPVIEPGEAITNGGGDNSTLNGIEEIDGTNPSKFSTMFKSLSPKVEAQLKQAMCEKNATVYFFLQGGLIACWQNDILTPLTSPCSGIPVQSLFVGDRSNAGFGSKDTNAFMFSIPSGWSEKLFIIKPSFNPFTDL